MIRYTLLNLSVLLVTVCILRSHISKIITRKWFTSLCVLLALTAVFDSFIIQSGIVAYNPDSILGVFIYKAPIEDFAYTIAALLIMPFLWIKLKDTHATKK